VAALSARVSANDYTIDAEDIAEKILMGWEI
jgi:hypothetical protein